LTIVSVGVPSSCFLGNFPTVVNAPVEALSSQYA